MPVIAQGFAPHWVDQHAQPEILSDLTAVVVSIDPPASHRCRVVESFGRHLRKHFTGSQDIVSDILRAFLRHLRRDLPADGMPTFDSSAGMHLFQLCSDVVCTIRLRCAVPF